MEMDMVVSASILLYTASPMAIKSGADTVTPSDERESVSTVMSRPPILGIALICRSRRALTLVLALAMAMASQFFNSTIIRAIDMFIAIATA
jgi:hypothetical protein